MVGSASFSTVWGSLESLESPTFLESLEKGSLFGEERKEQPREQFWEHS